MQESMLNELKEEAATTRRVLERVPSDRLSWRPHPKSMSLGELSMHVASIPGNLVGMAQLEELDASTANFDPPEATNLDQLLDKLDSSVKSAVEYLQNLDDATAAGSWRLLAKGKEVFTIPRSSLIRTVMLNHWYHHRGQLSVYLRLLDVPVPVIYGRSADENPFG
jgi:uncharacterized damage-inducible protein DinB